MILRNVICFLCLGFPLSFSHTNSTNIIEQFRHELVNLSAIQEQISDVLKSYGKDELIVKLKMFDASTKLPSGLLNGNFMDLGNFDECYDLKYKDIFGKYCLGVLPFSSLPDKYIPFFGLNFSNLDLTSTPLALTEDPRKTGFYIAICIPNNLDVGNISSAFIFEEKFCHSRAVKEEFSTGAITMIVIFSTYFVIIMGSTVYDIGLQYSKKPCNHRILVACSLLSNGQKLFKSSTNPEQLSCINGIKTFTMMWLVLCHGFLSVRFLPVSNFLFMTEWGKAVENMFVMGSSISVDSFLLISGIFAVYSFFRASDKGARFNLVVYYVHRYIRLTPVYIMIALFVMYLVNYMYIGPTWSVVDRILVQPCLATWWSSFLYITNFVQEGQCFPQTWYLSVDMQLFFVTPIFLILLKKSERIGLYVLGALSILGCVVPFIIHYKDNLSSALIQIDDDHMFYIYYSQSYTRFGPYVNGMILGYIIYKYKRNGFKIKIKPLMVVLLWLICITAIFVCVWDVYPLIVSKESNRLGNALYGALNRNIWSIAVGGIIFLCVTDNGGPINTFLSLTIFEILTKLSYAIYLIHYPLIIVRYSIMKTNIEFTNFQIIYMFWGNFMFTVIIACVCTLAFESPIVIIESYLFKRRKSPRNGH